jgi:hypothetical protein
MDHDAAREQMELAAIEPDGLERLMAGDTPTAQSVAGHLAGCAACSDELARLQRSAAVIKGTVRAMPPADLRARTLAAIRAEGVVRPIPGIAAGSAPTATQGPAVVAATAPTSTAVADAADRADVPGVVSFERRRLPPILGWAATIAAAVVLSVLATSYVVGSRVDTQLAAQAVAIKGLQEITTTTLTVTGQPDAEHVALANATDPEVYGGLTYSPSTAELVVVASGLTPPPSGLEYRCWVEVNGTRQRIGKMFFNDDLAFWVGPSAAVQGLSTGATFGVSLVDAGGSAVDTDPVLVGEL